MPDLVAKGKGTGTVRLLGAEAIPSVFATNVGITATEHEVTIAFFEAMLPISAEDLRGASMEVPARCVARVAMPLSRFDEVAGLFKKIADMRAASAADAATPAPSDASGAKASK